MNLSPQLIALGTYLAGEFDNQPQALAEPAWYVHLRLWKRPVPLFTEDSITLFAEQASVVNLEQPYRPRLFRLRQSEQYPQKLKVDYYMFKDISAVKGAGRNPKLLRQITTEQIEFLPDCSLEIEVEQLDTGYSFETFSTSEGAQPGNATHRPCTFTYQNNTYQVSLGFRVTEKELQTYDKGIDPQTGRAIWGALMGAYRFTKLQDFSGEIF